MEGFFIGWFLLIRYMMRSRSPPLYYPLYTSWIYV